MKQQTKSISQPPFSVIRGLLGANDNVTILTDAAWLFASTVLWNHFIFSGAERETCKELIRVELAAAASTSKAFVRFCETMILARIANPARPVTLPSQWFSGEDKKAAVTSLETVAATRRSLPAFQRSTRALAEAALEMSQEPTTANFRYWRGYFIEMQEPLLLELFTLYCANLHFIKD